MGDSYHPLVRIASNVGGASAIVVLILVIFAKEYAWISIPIVAALVALGIVLGGMSLMYARIETSASRETGTSRTRSRASAHRRTG